MIKFPALMYKSPGQIKKPCGATYNFVGVENQEQFDNYSAKGWFGTFEEAKKAAGDNAFPKPKVKSKWGNKKVKAKKPSKPLGMVKTKSIPVIKETEEDNTLPPTIEEIYEKATELGIKFDKRTSSKTLLKKIEEKLGA